MKNYVQKGDYLEVTAAADIKSGDGVLVGDLFGVAVTDIASGAKGNLATKGVFELVKATGDGGAAIWAPAYFDPTAKKVTATASGNVQVGLFANAPGDTATKALVLLSAQTGEKDEMVVSFVKAGATVATQAFFIAPVAMRVLKVSEMHGTKNTAAQTADITKDSGTDAAGAGVAVLGTTKLDLGAVENTVQSPALSGTAANLVLAAGDRLSFKPSIAGTQIADVVVTVHLARA